MSYDENPEYEEVEEEILAGEIGFILSRDKRAITQHGLRKIKLRFFASCGHLIHSLEELGGKCQHKSCDALVCRECLRTCQRCMKLICPKHQKIHNGAILCPTCKMVAIFFGFSPHQHRHLTPLYDVAYTNPYGR